MELHGKRVNATGKPNCVIYMSGALEVGDSPAEGRTGHHFHFVVVTKNRTTMSAVRKQFPQCDVRPLRGTIAEGEKYLNGHKKAGFKEPLRREILGDPPADKQGKGKGSHHMDEILAAIDDENSQTSTRTILERRVAKLASRLSQNDNNRARNTELASDPLVVRRNRVCRQIVASRISPAEIRRDLPGCGTESRPGVCFPKRHFADRCQGCGLRFCPYDTTERGWRDRHYDQLLAQRLRFS